MKGACRQTILLSSYTHHPPPPPPPHTHTRCASLETITPPLYRLLPLVASLGCGLTTPPNFHVIFHNFADWSGTAKIRRRETAYVKGVANLIRENCFRETLQITRSAKIVHLENLALYGIYPSDKLHTNCVACGLVYRKATPCFA